MSESAANRSAVGVPKIDFSGDLVPEQVKFFSKTVIIKCEVLTLLESNMII